MNDPNADIIGRSYTQDDGGIVTPIRTSTSDLCKVYVRIWYVSGNSYRMYSIADVRANLAQSSHRPST